MSTFKDKLKTLNCILNHSEYTVHVKAKIIDNPDESSCRVFVDNHESSPIRVDLISSGHYRLDKIYCGKCNRDKTPRDVKKRRTSGVDTNDNVIAYSYWNQKSGNKEVPADQVDI